MSTAAAAAVTPAPAGNAATMPVDIAARRSPCRDCRDRRPGYGIGSLSRACARPSGRRSAVTPRISCTAPSRAALAESVASRRAVSPGCGVSIQSAAAASRRGESGHPRPRRAARGAEH
jgi:hypothetical protein